MTRFYGNVGYVVEEEWLAGVWSPFYVERPYIGDVVRNIRRLEQDSAVNLGIALNNSFSIIADPYAYEHMHDIRYVCFQGKKWTVSSVEVQPPRLILSVTEEYGRANAL